MQRFTAVFIGVAVLAVFGAAFTPAGVFAQAYPTRAVRVIVPYAPGGGSDVISRILAQRMPPSDLAPYIKSEIVKWGKAVKASGARPE